MYVYNKLPDITKLFQCHVEFIVAKFDCTLTPLPKPLPFNATVAAASLLLCTFCRALLQLCSHCSFGSHDLETLRLTLCAIFYEQPYLFEWRVSFFLNHTIECILSAIFKGEFSFLDQGCTLRIPSRTKFLLHTCHFHK